MKKSSVLALVAASASIGSGSEVSTNPVQKTLELLSNLQSKIVEEGHERQEIYEKVRSWCTKRSAEVRASVRLGKAAEESRKAIIEKAADDIDAASVKIEELSVKISTDEGDLKTATEMRKKEVEDFKAAEAELQSTIGALEKAIEVFEKRGTSFIQRGGAKAADLAHVFSVMLEAEQMTSEDASRLTSLVQASEDSDDNSLDEPDQGESGSGGGSAAVIKVLEDLLEKAQGELSDTRDVEKKHAHNFAVLKQSSEDSIAFNNKQLDDTKKAKAAAAETKADTEASLEIVRKGYADDSETLAEMHKDCMQKATDFETELKTRDEELKALATAKKIVVETTGGAEKKAYGDAASFLQVRRTRMHDQEPGLKALHLVRRLAREKKSHALTQLATKVYSVLKRNHGDDVFEKVKGLISDMIAKLEKESEDAISKHAYCVKEMSETKEKQENKEAAIEGLTTKIDGTTSVATQIKEEIVGLQKQVTELTETGATLDEVRLEEKKQFEKEKADLEAGIKGVRAALEVLREYYAKDDDAPSFAQTSSNGNGIIPMLEVVESDFTKGLTEIIADEDAEVSRYHAESKANAVLKKEKEQDVAYKTARSKRLDKTSAEFSGDRDGIQTELDAVREYLEELKNQCIAKPDTFEKRTAKRNDEIAGLKEALNALSSSAPSFLQLRAARGMLRGVHSH